MELVQLIPLLLIVLLFWVMVVRPASRRQKQLQHLQHSLQSGQRVMLASGIFGTVRGLTEDRARVEVATGVEIEVARGAVNTVLDDPTDPTDPTGPTGPTGPASRPADQVDDAVEDQP